MAYSQEISKLSAIILCGGKGERLKPLTDNLPKPLIPINRRPMLEYLVHGLREQGIGKIAFAVGHKGEMIENYFIQNPPGIPHVTYNSGDVDIIQRIKDGLAYIPGDFLIFYGDTLSDVSIRRLVNEHHNSGMPMTVTVWPFKSSFGVFDIDENSKVTGFQEKPVLDKWINIGHFYYSRKLDSRLLAHNKFENFIEERVIRGELHAFKHTGIHLTVNTQLELQEAEKNINLLFPKEDVNEQFLDQ